MRTVTPTTRAPAPGKSPGSAPGTPPGNNPRLTRDMPQTPGLLEMLMAYVLQPGRAQGRSLFQYVRDENPHVLSHHPADACFREHVFQIGGLYVCKGCVMTVSGVIAGVAVALATGWLGLLAEAGRARWDAPWGELWVGGAFVAMLLPTVLTSLFGAPRPIKHVCRFVLGMLIGSAIVMLFVSQSWAIRGVIVATFFLVKWPLERKRRRDNDKALAAARPKTGKGRGGSGGKKKRRKGSR